MRLRPMTSFGLLGVLVSVSAWATPAAANPPWQRILSRSTVEADPNAEYTLADSNGPWMIMVGSFSGEGAEKQARDLVMELRRRYKLPAYVHQESFDYGEEDLGSGINRYGEPVRLRYRRGPSQDEFAVLVGDFADLDDPEAQRSLERIRHLQPDSLSPEDSRPTHQNLAGLRAFHRSLLPENNAKRQLGPMGQAFITTNPLLPQDFFVPQGLDPFVVQMNENAEFNLLENPGRYTVQVAHFTGRSTIAVSHPQAADRSVEAMDSALADAAMKAHTLAKALRMKGYEAYEFHDRYASIVTVGSFEAVGQPRADGMTEIDPRIHAIIETFRARPVDIPGQVGAMEPRMLAGIAFDIQPIPVEVPRPSVSSRINRRPLGLW